MQSHFIPSRKILCASILAMMSSANSFVFAQTCPFDQAGTSLAREGLVLTRYALGLRGDSLVANTGFSNADALTIDATISCADCGSSALDVNGTGALDVTDATIIARKIAGISGETALTNGLALGGGTRNTPTSINSFLLAGCSGGGGSTNAWIQGGNAFGAAGVLGTTDAQPLIVRSAGGALSLLLPANNGIRLTSTSLNDVINRVDGSSANSVGANIRGATIAGGGITAGATDPDFFGEGPNSVLGHWGTVSGGYANVAGNANDAPFAAFATVGGGTNNVAGGTSTVVAGGNSNNASGFNAAILGGNSNLAPNSYSVVVGGNQNVANGVSSFIGGGNSNTAPGGNAVIVGGGNNNASGAHSAVSGGFANTASGNHSIVAGGNSNLASGTASFAAGSLANANKDGCFAWGDNLNAVVECPAANSFVARARGGVSFYTGGSAGSYTGVTLPAGAGAWNMLSDVESKTAFANVDVMAVLAKLVRMPISSWQYKTQEASIRHIGPTAQAFKASFGLGDSDRGISTVDADGIAFAAIQGLHKKLEAQTKAINERDRRIAELQRANETLKGDIAAIKKRLGM
jgi:trimeric autotransporter adhesin